MVEQNIGMKVHKECGCKIESFSDNLFKDRIRQGGVLECLTMHWQEDDGHQGVIIESSASGLLWLHYIFILHLTFACKILHASAQNMQKLFVRQKHYFRRRYNYCIFLSYQWEMSESPSSHRRVLINVTSFICNRQDHHNDDRSDHYPSGFGFYERQCIIIIMIIILRTSSW